MAPGTSFGEIYFIAGMMVLILVICTVAVWAFIKTYKKEMRAKAKAEAERSARNASEPVTEADQDAA